jgi:hypothetical protein
MRKHTAALLLLLTTAAACGGGPRLAAGAPKGDVVLEVRGGVKGAPFRLGKDALAALPRRTVDGTDPATGQHATWEGIDLAAVAARVELKPGTDTLILRTGDRRAVAVPLNFIRTLRPVLADRADGQPIPDRVVAWPTAEQGGLLTDRRVRAWWARDVAVLELVNGWSITRAVLVPPGAAPGARLGADLVGARCLGCHRVRKAGGENGPDLTRIADRLSGPDFERLLLRGHPGWTDDHRDTPGEGAAADVYSFFRAVSLEAAVGAAEPEPPAPEMRQGPGGHGSEGPGGY